MRTIYRTIRIPIEFLPDETWMLLRKQAFECSRYGNYLLSESYAKAKGLVRTGGSLYREFDSLSASVKDAVGRECVGIWRRLGKKILRGEQTLARFSADRSLVVRGRDVALVLDSGRLLLRVRVLPAKDGEAMLLPIYMPALKRDVLLAEKLSEFSAGDCEIGKATIMFRRPGRKVFVFVSYPKQIEESNGYDNVGLLRFNESGELWISCDGRKLNLNEFISRLVTKKAQFAAIKRRLFSDLGKSGNRRRLRRVLMTRQSFSEWADGPIKQLAARVSRWCLDNRIGTLNVTLPVKEERDSAKSVDAPWYRIVSAITNRCQADGIRFVLQEPSADLKKDWSRIAGMLEAYKKFESFGPSYDARQ